MSHLLRHPNPKTFDEQLLSGRQMPRERISPIATPHRTQYSREVDIGISSFLANEDETIDSRPVVLTRWAFDDYICEHMWDDDAQNSSQQPNRSHKQLDGRVVCAEVISEGIPDSEIVLQIQQRLGIHAGARAREESRVVFTSPCDFVGVARRRVFLPQVALNAPAFRDVQLITNKQGGRAHISRAVLIAGVAPPHAVRHTFVLRGCSSGLSAIFDRIQRIENGQGVANYTDVAQHGYHLQRAFSSGLHLLDRDHQSFITKYLSELTEGSGAVQKDTDRIASLISSPASGEYRLASVWKSVEASLQVSVGRTSETAADGHTGLYLPHLSMLRQFVERVSAMPENSRIDSAKLIRENISRRVLVDRLRSLTDVHFNAWASLRLKMLSHSVQVGDVVVVDSSKKCKIGLVSSLDPRVTRRDHSFGMGEHLNYVDLTPFTPTANLPATTSGASVRVVTSETDAAQFQLDDVILPLFGRTLTMDGSDKTDADPNMLFPHHRFGKATSDELAQRLQLAPLSLMKLANPPSYRPLAVKPRNIRCLMVDDMRNVQHGDATLAAQTLIDREGVRRFRSPLSVILGESTSPPSRSGIKTREAREKFIGLASRPGFTVFLQFDLPFGSSPNSVLREIVKTRTVDPGAILATLMRRANPSSGRRR
jgi:hypothetical protein